MMEFNHQVLTYGQFFNSLGQTIQTTDRLFSSTGGIIVKVDREFSVEGKVTSFPFEPIIFGEGRPAFGTLFSLSLIFRPI